MRQLVGRKPYQPYQLFVLEPVGTLKFSEIPHLHLGGTGFTLGDPVHIHAQKVCGLLLGEMGRLAQLTETLPNAGGGYWCRVVPWFVHHLLRASRITLARPWSVGSQFRRAGWLTQAS